MKKLIVFLIVLVAASTSAGFYLSRSEKKPAIKSDTSNSKVAASVNAVTVSEQTAKSLKSLKFDNDADYNTLTQAIANIPRNDVLQDFNN